ncbi:MAG: galactokinase [Nocardioides sp.]|uniref:galactokinase n=1 Tax=Nocardioides sp. TaxID=35761 RepID=UPI0039E542EF
MILLKPGTPAELSESTRKAFRTTYGSESTVVGRSPGRVNLIGEHTDYNRGLCLPVALPHATYAAAAPRADGLFRMASRQADEPWQGTIADVGPGRPQGWAAYAAGVIWALADLGYHVPGLDLFVDSTVPVGAGLSSSAAMECSVAAAIVTLTGGELTADVRAALLPACMRAEIEVAGAPTGGMDQSVALFGQVGHALLLDFADGSRTQVPLALAEAGLSPLVIDTRVSHALIDGGYAARRADCERATAELGLESLREASLDDVGALTDERVRRRARHVVTEIERVREVVAAATAQDWARVGRAFWASHVSLRDDFEVSCVELDLVVDTAMRHGAVGARMTGGGFGGAAIALMPTTELSAVAEAIEAAFAAADHTPPAFLVPEPSAGVSVE